MAPSGEASAQAVDPGTLEQQLERARRRLALTLEIGRSLASSTDREHLYERIIDNVTEIMDADRSTLYLVEPDRQSLVSRVSQGEAAPEIRLRVGEGIAGAVAQHGRVVNVVDAYADPRFQSSIDGQTGYRTQSVLCLPLTNSVDEVIGVLQILNKRGGDEGSDVVAFDEEDVELAKALAGQVAIAVENSVLYHEAIANNIKLMTTSERLRKQSSDIGVLLQLEREVSSAISPRDIYDRLLRAAMELVGARSGSIALMTEGGKLLRFETVAGPFAHLVRGRRIGIGEGVIGWVAANREAVIVNEPGDDPRHDRGFAADVGEAPQSLVCAPLVSEDEILGAIELIDRPGGFSKSHLQLTQLIAGQVARAAVTARRRSKAEIEGRLATVGQMMANVLHDLRTPMTVISGYTELMAMSPAKEARDGYAAHVLRQLEIMNGMIREILAFARGDTTLLLTAIHVNGFLAEVETQLRRDLSQRGVELAIDDQYGGDLRADRVKLLRLVTNLAQNAVEAMGERGTFSIRCTRDGDDVVFEFADDGPGIPDELEGRLFEAFARGRSGGTGLGLAIVKRIVDQHEGTVGVESVRGRGTTFRVKLPIGGPRAPVAPAT